jgi:hypothetical protein
MFEEEKIKIQFPKLEVQSFEFNGSKILVKPFISDTDQRILIGIYLQELFNPDGETPEMNFLNAENSLLINVLEILTNVKLIDNVDGKDVALFNINDVFSNMEFFRMVSDRISNFGEFRHRLAIVVESKKEERRLDASMGQALNVIYAKLVEFLEELPNMDFSKYETLIQEVNNSPILKESIELFKNQKKAE